MSYELIKNYDKSKHLETLEKNDFKFEYLFSSNWNSIDDIPYVLRTHLLDSLSEKLKELIKTRQTFLSHNNQTYTLKLNSNKEYIQFILFNILYAIRNNTVHGKIASRLNSEYVNSDSYNSSKYIYLLGYMFLSVMLYVSDELDSSDLIFNLTNLPKL